MAVTETTAETDGSLTAVTVSETESFNQTTHNRRRRVPGMTDDMARQAVRLGRRMGRVVYTS